MQNCGFHLITRVMLFSMKVKGQSSQFIKYAKIAKMSGCNESAFYLQNGEVSELEHHAQDLPVHVSYQETIQLF